RGQARRSRRARGGGRGAGPHGEERMGTTMSGMKKSDRVEGPLTTAAIAFERELARYEQITAELRRTTVKSEKTLHRTKALLTECGECEQRLGEHLGMLVAAMNGSRDKQQVCMELSVDASERFRSRTAE